MLHRGIIAVCSEIHTKHKNILCGLKLEYLNVKAGGVYSYHLASTSQIILTHFNQKSSWLFRCGNLQCIVSNLYV
jgi:hypothetical protein